MSSPAKALLDQVRFKKLRFVVFKMENLEPASDLQGDLKSTWATLKEHLTETEPRFIAYDLAFVTADGRKSSKLLFIYWKPVNIPQNDRILYAQALPQIKAAFGGSDYKEVEDEDELEELLSKEEF